MNRRVKSTELQVDDVRELFDRQHNARRLSLPFTAMLSFAPFSGHRETPAADEMWRRFKRLLKHLTVWVRRHTGKPFTYVWVIHSSETGARPHLHVLFHLPTADHRESLLDALKVVYPDPGTLHLREASDEVFGTEYRTAKSALGYMIRFMSQQAYISQRKKFNREHVVVDGKRVGVKAPVVGRRWSSSRNIIGKNQERDRKRQKAEAA